MFIHYLFFRLASQDEREGPRTLSSFISPDPPAAEGSRVGEDKDRRMWPGEEREADSDHHPEEDWRCGSQVHGGHHHRVPFPEGLRIYLRWCVRRLRCDVMYCDVLWFCETLCLCWDNLLIHVCIRYWLCMCYVFMFAVENNENKKEYLFCLVLLFYPGVISKSLWRKYYFIYTKYYNLSKYNE